jgi:poly-beta-1,6-N-acetyl-D-glucosamine synthase
MTNFESIAVWCFWMAAAVWLYIQIGYPVLLVLLSLCVRRRPALDGFTPFVTLIIPAHDEEQVIEAKLRNTLALNYPRDRLEVIVASDGSTDRTVALARPYAAKGVRVLAFPVRRGKASVVNDAAEAARGKVLCLCDANVMFRPDALGVLAGRLADPLIGAATGDVRLASGDSDFGHGESLYYRLERRLQQAESDVGSVMGVDGGMYVLWKELFQPLAPDTILDDFVVSMRVIRQGRRVVYDPRAIADENGTPLAVQEFRRRVRVAAGAVQSLKRGDWPGFCRPVEAWQYASHKFLRWLGPLTLPTLLAGNAFLWDAGVFYRVTLAAQLCGYLLAVGAMVSVRFRKFRLGAVPFYLVMSHLAMAVGYIKGLFNAQKVTWRQAARVPVPPGTGGQSLPVPGTGPLTTRLGGEAAASTPSSLNQPSANLRPTIVDNC